MFSYPSLTVCWLLVVGLCLGLPQIHDENFQPDFVLEAIAKPVSIACGTRYSITINGTVPGPTIALQENQTSWIRVYNRIPDRNFTLHFHGLSQRTAPFSDGTPLVSQWPIPPNHFFDYEIRPDFGDAGTYFYHSHEGFQQSTAHGAVVVKDAESPPYKYDEEIVLLLADYFNSTDNVIETGLQSKPFKWSGEPEAITLSGQSGQFGLGDAHDDTCAPLIIDVDPSKEYRIRAIGATVLSFVKLGIEQHNCLRIIEADGSYTEGAEIDHIQVAPGQRFSFLLKTKSYQEIIKAGITQFWIQYESRDRPKSVRGYALLNYRLPGDITLSPFPAELPTTSPPVILPNTTSNYMEYTLQPINGDDGFPSLDSVTRTVTLQVNQMVTNGGTNHTTGVIWTQNGNTWIEGAQAAAHQTPYLIDIYQYLRSPNYSLALENGGYDPTSQAFPARVGEVIDIVWQNNAGFSGGFDSHPMHIHGKHAWDLGSGSGLYNATENEAKFANYTPIHRDTTMLYRYTERGQPHITNGWRAWRVRVTEDNIGAWMMHCHIAQHAVMGMNTIWIFGDAKDVLHKFPALPYVQGYLDFGGSAYGNKSQFPVVNHHFG